MNTKPTNTFLFSGLCVALAASFWFSSAWTTLAAGLALFLFGMQCLEEGLHLLAGERMERLLARFTDRVWKSLSFGLISTVLVQSSSLVSLLAIAFLGAGLIGLGAGLCIIFGANVGTTSGIWLLALAGQSASLSNAALPFVVFGVLCGFYGNTGKGVGRVLLGVGLLFLGIDMMQRGFSGSTQWLDPSHIQVDGVLGVLLFSGVGALATVVLQSSHASMMLTLTALAGGQIGLEQAFAIAIGANIGSTITAVLGSLSGARVGKRLALGHVLFNGVTGVVVMALLAPFSALTEWLAIWLGMNTNTLFKLALFHTLFNALGVLLFLPWYRTLVVWLERWVPDNAEPTVLITEVGHNTTPALQQTRARYLDENALGSAEAAVQAVARELQHLARLSLEVICHALYLPIDQLHSAHIDAAALQRAARPNDHRLDADTLYQRHIKGVYADLLDYMSRLETRLDSAHSQDWTASQVVAMQLVDAVKDAKHLQKNLGRLLADPTPAVAAAYAELRAHMLWVLREVRAISVLDLPETALAARLQVFDAEAAHFDAGFRERLFEAVRNQQLNGLHASSLMNDVGYASRITQSLRNVLMLGLDEKPYWFLQRPFYNNDDKPLIRF